MSPRTEVAEYLATELPDFRVLPYARQLDGPVPGQVVVMVETTEYRREASLWHAEVTVYVVVGGTDLAVVEDDLEAGLEEVLGALAVWNSALSAATRVIYQDTLNAYQIKLDFPLKEL